jgi:uncharacterized membrane protein
LKSLATLHPEIAVQPQDTLTIPVVIRNSSLTPADVSISVDLPARWTVPQAALPPTTVLPQGQASVLVRAIAPAQVTAASSEIKIHVQSAGKVLFEDNVSVQVSAYVAGQVK